MKKFYAPTGTFKRGPIALPGTSPPAESTETAPESSSQDQPQKEDAGKDRTPPPRPAEPAEVEPQRPRATSRSSSFKPSAHHHAPTTTSPSPEALSSAADVTADSATPSATPPSSSPAAPASESTPFEEFARKWRMYLYPGQLSIMRTLHELTSAVGATECFTRYSELARATRMSRRNCINVVNSLVDRGFVERLEVKNDATGKGIRLRVHLSPRP